MVKKKYVKRYKKKRNGIAAIRNRSRYIDRLLSFRRRKLKRCTIDYPTSRIDTSFETDTNSTQNCPRYTFSTDIPDRYNETYICALPRNPDWVFVYWEIGPDCQDSLNREHISGARYILRTEEIAFRAQEDLISAEKPVIADKEIDSETTECYVKVPQPGKEYTITVGQKEDNGAFHPIISTEPFATVQKFALDLVESTGVHLSSEPLFSKSEPFSEATSSDQKRYFGSATPD